MVSGTLPSLHGIIGNRFWFGNESVGDIRNVLSNPVSTLHPYRASCRLGDSVADSLRAAGARIAAVHFPSLFDERSEYFSMYSVYSPAQQLSVIIDETVPFTIFDWPYRMSVTAGRGGFTVEVTDTDDMPVWDAQIRLGSPTELLIPTPVGRFAAHVTVTGASRQEVFIFLGTGTLVLSSDDNLLGPSAAWGSSSPAPSYPGGVDDFFCETPSENWVFTTARQVIERTEPDVLFVRFNQADHAQEHLFWQAVRGAGEAAVTARNKIFSVYDAIEARVQELVADIGNPNLVVLTLSDHGIDYVEEHLNPNVVVEDLGLAERAVFQGDSNIAFLYGPSLTSREVDSILQTTSCATGASRVGSAKLNKIGLPGLSPRVGRGALLLGAHREFSYGLPGLHRTVRSASHGAGIEYPTMAAASAITAPFELERPQRITDVRRIVEQAWIRTGP
nr:alkaline phosphatase family protein [Pseudonocardia sp. HH130629-09]